MRSNTDFDREQSGYRGRSRGRGRGRGSRGTGRGAKYQRAFSGSKYLT